MTTAESYPTAVALERCPRHGSQDRVVELKWAFCDKWVELTVDGDALEAHAKPPAGHLVGVHGLPVVPVDDLVEGASLGAPDDREGPVGRVPESQHVGEEAVLREAEHVAGEILILAAAWPVPTPRSAAAIVIAMVACPRSYWSSRGGLPGGFGGDDGDCGGRPGDVSGAPPHPGQPLNCARSVTTTKSHGCQLLADGVRRPASRIWSRWSAAGAAVKARTLRRARMASQVSMRLPSAVVPSVDEAVTAILAETEDDRWTSRCARHQQASEGPQGQMHAVLLDRQIHDGAPSTTRRGGVCGG